VRVAGPSVGCGRGRAGGCGGLGALVVPASDTWILAKNSGRSIGRQKRELA